MDKLQVIETVNQLFIGVNKRNWAGKRKKNGSI